MALYDRHHRFRWFFNKLCFLLLEFSLIATRNERLTTTACADLTLRVDTVGPFCTGTEDSTFRLHS